MIKFDGHTTVIGGTGSGKTYATLKSLPHSKKGVLFFNTMHNKTFGGFTKASGNNYVSQLQKLLQSGKKVNYIPSERPEQQRRELAFLIDKLWGTQMILAVDEVHLFNRSKDKAVADELERVATTGRHKGMQGVWISQRPANIDNTLMTQSEQFVIFKTQMEVSYFKNYNIPYEEVFKRLDKGGQYSYVTYDFQNVEGAFKIR